MDYKSLYICCCGSVPRQKAFAFIGLDFFLPTSLALLFIARGYRRRSELFFLMQITIIDYRLSQGRNENNSSNISSSDFHIKQLLKKNLRTGKRTGHLYTQIELYRS